MNSKVKPSEVLSKTIKNLLNGTQHSGELLTDLLRSGAGRILQQATEAEIDGFSGRGWYERGDQGQQRRHRGYRNGYTPVRVKTTQGPITLQRPRVRENAEHFESAILSRIDLLEDRLVKLATEMYVRGISTRDIEESLVGGHGKAVLSRSVTSRLTEQLYAEYESWAKQDLSGHDVVYLFADGVYESVHHYTNGQTILCARGICSDGRKVLLGLRAVASEAAECWTEFFQDLKDRGLAHPLLVVSDGAGGLKSAIARCFPLAKAFIEEYGPTYPSMIKRFNDDLQAYLVHLKYPNGHRCNIRTTNLIERSFVEQKRRTKIVPNHVNEKGAMKLVYGTLIRAAKHWQRVSLDQADLVLLNTLRQSMCNDHQITINYERISFTLAA